MGDTTSHPPHPFSRPGASAGYVKQKDSSKGATEEFGLRCDIGKNRGVTTLILHGSGNDLDLERGNGAWKNSESKLTEVSSDEEEGLGRRSGIMITSNSAQIADRVCNDT